MGAIAIENSRFKQNYGRYLLDSVVVAILVHFLIFYFTPPFEIEPYIYKGEAEPQCILVEDQPEVILEPEDIGLPPIPMVYDGGEVDGETDFEPTVYYRENIPGPSFILKSKTSIAPVVFNSPPQIMKYVNPVYPELARSAGIEGEVVLKVVVGKDGKVVDVSIIRSNVTPSMEKAAIEAAKKLLFRPAMQGGVPLQVSVEVPIKFRLR